jgi:hypothetical protein
VAWEVKLKPSSNSAVFKDDINNEVCMHSFLWLGMKKQIAQLLPSVLNTMYCWYTAFSKLWHRDLKQNINYQRMTGTVVEENKINVSHRRPFNCMETFTPCIFLAYFGDMFFSLFSIIWGHSVTASC